MSDRAYTKSPVHDAVGRALDALGIDPDRKVELMDAAGRVRRVYIEDPSAAWKALRTEVRQETSRSRTIAAETRALGRTLPQLARAVDRHPAAVRNALRDRIRTVVTILDPDSPVPQETTALLAALISVLESEEEYERSCRHWLALSVIAGRLATPDEVVRAVRLARSRGPLAGLATRLVLRSGVEPTPVRVAVGAVVVDVHTTAHSDVLTGIQRVVHQSVRRWHRDHAIELVGWTPGYAALRPLSDAETRAVLSGEVLGKVDRAQSAYTVTTELVVPWKCTYLLPELVTDLPRSDRIQGIARFSCSRSATIGYDCVPISSGETCGPGTPSGFVRTLAAVAHFDRVAAISEAAAEEYRGWRTMLAGAGLAGPDVAAIPLAVEASEPTAEEVSQVRASLTSEERPMVLCVGSHEPRKNHLAVLHAAELLWRGGLNFNLVFIGGNSWKDDGFAGRVADLIKAGRPVVVMRAAGDDLLWGAYKAARCTIFPSFNEGFGLPVAESLALATPAITSNFGSMAEIAAGGGALMVDPRDDQAIAIALRELLTDDDLHARLSAEATRRPVRTWDAYAEELWEYVNPESQGQG